MSQTTTAGLIAALAPLGGKFHLAFILAYADDATSVTLTINLRPKEGTKGEPRTLQIAGAPAEVDTEIAAKLVDAVDTVLRHTSSLETLAADLAAEEKAARENGAAKKPEPAKPAEQPAAAKKPAKGKTPEKAPEPPAPAAAAPGPTPPAAEKPAATEGKTAAELAILTLADEDPAL